LKITKEMLTLIFEGFDNDLGNNYGVNDTSKDEEIQHMQKQIIQQILNNQTIVERLRKHMDDMNEGITKDHFKSMLVPSNP